MQRPPLTVIEGQGLHTGAPGRLTFMCGEGPVRVRCGDVEARVDELGVAASVRSTAVSTRDGRIRVGTVEHLFAALGALSIYEGLVVELDGPEVPLADGGAGAFMDAMTSLGAPRSSSSLVVARAGSIAIGTSRYDLRPADRVEVEVEVDFDDTRLARVARWDGDADDFRDRIAPARTFGFEREVEELLARGLANHVGPSSVVIIGRDRILSAGRVFTNDEPARHKLLDLVGDLYVYGGPPLGAVHAVRPGHAATHEAIGRALDRGLLERRRDLGKL